MLTAGREDDEAGLGAHAEPDGQQRVRHAARGRERPRPGLAAGLSGLFQRHACVGCCDHLEGPSFTAYFVYPEELKTSKRVGVFRDFLLEKVAEQPVW